MRGALAARAGRVNQWGEARRQSADQYTVIEPQEQARGGSQCRALLRSQGRDYASWR